MLKKLMVPFLLCSAFAGVSAHANASSISGASVASAKVVSTKSIYWSCGVATSSSKGFRGDMHGTVKTFSDGRKDVHISRVNIHKHGGQGGGNKANFEAHMTGWNGSATFASRYSGDNMKQDGSNNNVNMSMAAYNSNSLRFKFTFDKSGNDPKCTSNIAI